MSTRHLAQRARIAMTIEAQQKRIRSMPKKQSSKRVYIARPGGKAIRLNRIEIDLGAILRRMHAN